MTYLLRERKWIAWVVLLTFLFTSFMPSSAWADSSTDVAAQGNGEQTIMATLFDYGRMKDGVWDTDDVSVLNQLAGQEGMRFIDNANLDNGNPVTGLTGWKIDESNEHRSHWGIVGDTLVDGLPVLKYTQAKLFSDRDEFAEVNDGDRVQYKKAGVPYKMPFTYSEQNNLYTFDSGQSGFWPLGPNEEHFGMKMAIDFMQPVNGKLDENTDMTFSFSGDDDLWVFIDGKLALDLGGVHGVVSGTINFADKKVIYDDEVENLDDGKNIEVPFSALGLDLTEMEEHEMQIFYLERGGWNSNCKIQFNLLRFTGNPNLLKKVEGNTAFLDLQKEYTFEVWTKEDGNPVLFSNQQYTVNGIGKDTSGNAYKTDNNGQLRVKAADIVAFDVDAGTEIQMKEILSPEEHNKYATTVHVAKMEGKDSATLENVTGKDTNFHVIPAVESGKVNYIFTNSLAETNDLQITKKLAAKNNGEKFQFQVYFRNSVGENGMVKPMPEWTLYNGSYTVEGNNYQAEDGIIWLSADKTASIKDIPVDTEYFVTEVLESGSYTVAEELQTVVAPEADSEAADNGNTIVESGTLLAGTMGLAGKIENSENANAVTITNIPITEKIAIRGQKIWQGDSELDRPETITIHIMKGNAVVATTTSSLTMDWKYEVSGLQKYDTDGKLIPYTVKEEPVSGYVAKMKQPVMTDEANEYVVTITNAKSSVLDGMINLSKQVIGDISNASTNKFAFKLTMTIDSEEANAEEEVNTAVAQTLDAEYENALNALDEELNAAWKEVLAAVDGFKEVCAEIMPEAKAQLPEEEEKAEEAAAKLETGVETAETQVAETEDAALENSAEETVDAGADADLADKVENDSETEDLATAESTSEDGAAEAAVVEEACTVEESDFSEAPEEAADDVVSYSTESYSMVARTLNSIEFKVLNGEGNVTANEIVGRLAALLSQKEISDADATNQLSLVLMLALDQEDLDDVEREEALAVVADAMVEMPAEQAAYTPEQLQRLYQAAGEVLEKYEIYQERKTEKAAFDATQIETARLYDGLEVADPVAATPSAIQLVLDYGKDKKVTVELKRQENGTYVYEGIELMDGQSVGIDVKATTGSAINFTITETETGDAKTVDFQQGTTTWMETTSVSGRIAPGQSVSYTAINTFDAEEETEDPVTPEDPTPVEPIPTEPTVPTEPMIPVEPTPTEPAPTEPIPTTPEPSAPETTIDDPDVPLAEPEVTDEVEPAEPTEPTEPDVEIFDLAVPLSDMPGKTVEEAIQIDEPQVPLSDAPQTGDNSKAIPFMLLMMVAGCGLVITRKRFN